MSLIEKLREFEGLEAGPPHTGRDPVNLPMIHHWCDAVGDTNPAYTDAEFAGASRHGGLIAPPTMLQAWAMRGLAPRPGVRDVRAKLNRLLDEAGFTSIVATNCDQEYFRALRPGDQLTQTIQIEKISDEKNTRLGRGHFIHQLWTFRDQNGEPVGTMRFRLLKFRPAATGKGARRPRPVLTYDNAFFWEGVKKQKLLIQRCAACQKLRHPPEPMCPACQSLDWDTVEASGRGSVYSFVVAHHPPIPPFEYPLVVALIELEEGVRLISDLVDVEPEDVYIGQPVEVEFRTVEDDLVLPQFRPAKAASIRP